MRRLALLLAALAVTAAIAWAVPRLERPPTRFEVARELIEAGRAEEAAYLFERPVWRGIAAYRAGRYSRALGEFFLEENTLTLYNMGTAYARLQEWNGAIAAYQKVLRLDPGHDDARHNLAVVTEAAALARRLAAESRTERKLGRWRDGQLKQPQDDQSGSGETLDGGEAGQGEARGAGAAAAAEDSSAGRQPGSPGERVRSERPGTAAAAQSPSEPHEAPEQGLGASALATAREERQAAEILLRQVVDDPARVLSARLFHAHRARLAGKVP